MVDVFPTHIFGFLAKEVNIERQTLKGGTALSGEQDTVSTDGGGRVFAEFGDGSLVDRSANLAWRAVVTLLEEGVTAFDVPFCETRFTPYGGSSGVPHSDGSPFSDGSLYEADGGVASISTNAALRATTVQMTLALPQPLIGGEWFAIRHANKGWRAYRVSRISGASISFRPPLREAVTVGEVVDFMHPRCLMVADGRPGTPAQYGRLGQAAIRFVEAP